MGGTAGGNGAKTRLGNRRPCFFSSFESVSCVQKEQTKLDGRVMHSRFYDNLAAPVA